MINLNWQPGMTLEAIEEHAIKQAFQFYQGNKSATSRALDISVRTLETKLEKYGADEATLTQRTLDRKAKSDAWLRRARGLPAEPGDDVHTTPGSHPRASAESRMDVQSAEGARAEQSVPLSKRQEVQEVSSKSASRTGSSRGR